MPCGTKKTPHPPGTAVLSSPHLLARLLVLVKRRPYVSNIVLRCSRQRVGAHLGSALHVAARPQLALALGLVQRLPRVDVRLEDSLRAQRCQLGLEGGDVGTQRLCLGAQRTAGAGKDAVRYEVSKPMRKDAERVLGALNAAPVGATIAAVAPDGRMSRKCNTARCT